MTALVYKEYIRCNISKDTFRKELKPYCLILLDSTQVFNNPNCFCIPNELCKFLSKFFNLKKLTNCKCSICGNNTAERRNKYFNTIGYSLYECFGCTDLKKYCKDMNGLLVNFPDNFQYLDKLLKIYAILTCAHFNTLIDRYYRDTDYINVPQFTTMLDNIKKAYTNINAKTNKSLIYQVFFYICFCLRGTGTFNVDELLCFFKNIVKYNKKTASEICDNVSEIISYKEKNVGSLTYLQDIMKIHRRYNYLACVCQFLHHISTEIELLGQGEFRTVLKQVNVSFTAGKSDNIFNERQILLKMQECMDNI